MTGLIAYIKNTFLNVDVDEHGVQQLGLNRYSTDPQEYCASSSSIPSYPQSQVSSLYQDGGVLKIESSVNFKIDDEEDEWEVHDEHTDGHREKSLSTLAWLDSTEDSEPKCRKITAAKPHMQSQDKDPPTVDDFNVTEDEWTTVMIRNIPNNMTREGLAQLLENRSCTSYNFLYVPRDLHRSSGLGYAFVNFLTNADAKEAWNRLTGFKDWKEVEERFTSTKECKVCWGREDQQGWHRQVEYYKNSPLMHHSVPDDCRPALFQDGNRIEFPPPTKKLRPPRLKNCRPTPHPVPQISYGPPGLCPPQMSSPAIVQLSAS
mmetsp:Transcript_13333/g.25142  ORF Transcript_13333/g.25142 Transcript_13333/m.25142 type:complete len:318 (-) Transcript_13333:77-1030(-)